MLSVICLIYSLLVFAIPAALCIWLGYRRGLFNSAMRLGFFLLSGILAFVIAKLLVNPIGGAVSDIITGMLGETGARMADMSSLQQLVVKLGGGLLAPIVFMPIFFVIDKLTFFAYIPLKKKFANHEKLHALRYDKVLGAVLGGVLSVCITLTCIMPVGGYPSLAAETTDQIASTSFAEEMPTDVTESIDTAADQTIVKIDYALSGWLFRGLASDARSAISASVSLLGLVDTLENTQDVSSVSAALQDLPAQSFKFLLSVARDAVTQLSSDDNSPYRFIAIRLLEALSDLPAMYESLSSEEYAKEMEALATITMMISNPSSITDIDIIKTALSSSILTTVILDNSEMLAEELSDTTSDLSKREKQEIKKIINEYADAAEIDDEIVTALLSIFGIV